MITRPFAGRALAALTALALPALVGCDSAPSRERQLSSRLVEGTPLYDVLPLDGIPAIDDPDRVSASDADLFLVDDEPVLGVVGEDGTAVAYSAWQLETHEIVNDEIDGHPLAVTW